jgi:hypothetical protein
MFIGHFAVGFASKRFAPRTNLAVLLAAPLLLDILWPFFVLFGWEQVRIDPGNTAFTPFDFVSYPWSHSLAMSMVWASLFAAIYFLVTRYAAGAMIVWIGVVSHWVLDWISHGPDMPLYPGGPRLGLGLWNSIPATMVVELVLFAGGLILYVMATRARDRIGRYAFIAYTVLLLMAYLSDRLGGAPPSSINGDVIVPAIIAEAVLLPWAWWFDRHRALRQPP